ncbi:golgi uridine diphosphate-N-acetylglucosamine transporter [Oleoguttula sp. CCFEE 5521]
MIAGSIRGKRYSRLQVASVALLTVGVLGKSMTIETKTSTSEFTTGLSILMLAQLLSAYMGAYVEDTYASYGASWTENLFYSHFLSLPFFLPLSGPMRRQWTRLASTPALNRDVATWPSSTNPILADLLSTTPRGLVFLLINATTQLACISGVNLLSAKSSAVTVTIVLNIRKLVSFMLSTWLFGHELSAKMLLGSALVFGSGALYGWETSWRLPRVRKQNAADTQGKSKVANGVAARPGVGTKQSNGSIGKQA